MITPWIELNWCHNLNAPVNCRNSLIQDRWQTDNDDGKWDVDARIVTHLLAYYSEPIPPWNNVPSQAGTSLKLLDIGGHGYNITDLRLPQ